MGAPSPSPQGVVPHDLAQPRQVPGLPGQTSPYKMLLGASPAAPRKESSAVMALAARIRGSCQRAEPWLRPRSPETCRTAARLLPLLTFARRRGPRCTLRSRTPSVPFCPTCPKAQSKGNAARAELVLLHLVMDSSHSLQDASLMLSSQTVSFFKVSSDLHTFGSRQRASREKHTASRDLEAAPPSASAFRVPRGAGVPSSWTGLGRFPGPSAAHGSAAPTPTRRLPCTLT